jgi:membrane fusion protein (multidrug efflux system)
MIRFLPIPVLLLCAVAFSACRKSASDEESADGGVTPTANVQTMKLERGTISATVTAYGTVIAQPGELESISVQYESKVVRLLVSEGQPVAKEQALIEIEPSPDAKLALLEAETAAETAQTELEQTKKRFSMKLAVNSELQQAQHAARDAEAKLASLQQRGAGGRTTLKSDLNSIVSTIEVRMGQIVAPGSPLLSLVPEKQIEVRLGVEPEDAGHLKIGEKVRIIAVNQEGDEVTGEIRLVTRRVNPQTRLVDVFASVLPDVPLLLDGYIRGEIRTEENQAFIVPRDAVLPGENGSVLFTVRDGHAVRHEVAVGLETDTETEVKGGDLRVGDEIVTVGNYQLEEGMAVNTAHDTK